MLGWVTCQSLGGGGGGVPTSLTYHLHLCRDPAHLPILPDQATLQPSSILTPIQAPLQMANQAPWIEYSYKLI